jgi:hypothetical protein
MTNVQFMTHQTPEGETIEFVVIDHGNEEFTSMSKSEYERRQAEQSTPILPA